MSNYSESYLRAKKGHPGFQKVIFIETFANSNSPTKAGKIIYKFADYFIVQWESMLKFYPKAIYGGWIY